MARLARAVLEFFSESRDALMSGVELEVEPEFL